MRWLDPSSHPSATPRPLAQTLRAAGATAHVDQPGGIGVLNMMASTAADYATSGNTLWLSDGRNQIPYSYCVSKNTLTMTPTWSLTGTTTGTIVLQQQ
jgi:hypothetical protein